MPPKLFKRAMAEDRGGQLPMEIQRDTLPSRVVQAGHWDEGRMSEGG